MVQLGKDDIPADEAKKDAIIDIAIQVDGIAESCELCRAVAAAGCRLCDGDEGNSPTGSLTHNAMVKDAALSSLPLSDLAAENEPAWADLEFGTRASRLLLVWIGRPIVLLALLYLFICSLGLLSSAFQLLGGRTAGAAFSSSELMRNPIAGLMIGVLATVLLQSSSTSTSIIVTMVASQMLTVRSAIPIVMGANIGTSVTSTLVALAQSSDREQFRRSFAAATVHDMFNWLAVVTLLPLECAAGYLEKLTTLITGKVDTRGEGHGGEAAISSMDFLKMITRPITDNIIQLDKKLIEKIATGQSIEADQSLVKKWCGYDELAVAVNITNSTLESNATSVEWTMKVPTTQCSFLFHSTSLSDSMIGVILLVGSLVLLGGCLVLVVRLLNSMLRGHVAGVVQKRINADLPCRWAAPLTGYVAMAGGALATALLQSSSVFTATLTPLAGVGVVSLERVYPLTLGANIGTTATSLLAAAASGKPAAIQVALCHLCFNVSAIVLFYPVPCMRWPLPLARDLAERTARYRWFAGVYLIGAFFALPGALLGTAILAGPTVFAALVGVVASILALIIVTNIMQSRFPQFLPTVLCTWQFLPAWMRSLEPYDKLLSRTISTLKAVFRCCGALDRHKPKERTAYTPIYKPTTCHAHPTVLPSGGLFISSTQL